MPLWLAHLFGHYGYIALFAGVFLENVGIPVPGETFLLAAGFLSKEHVLRLAIVIPCAIVAAISGDNLGYFIGRKGGRAFAERRGKYIGLTPKRLDRVDEYFRRRGAQTIFFARFISGVRVVAAVGAGVSAVPWRRFVVYNAAGAIAWAVTIASLGFLFGHSWHLLEKWIGDTGLLLVALVVAGFIVFTLVRRRRHARA